MRRMVCEQFQERILNKIWAKCLFLKPVFSINFSGKPASDCFTQKAIKNSLALYNRLSKNVDWQHCGAVNIEMSAVNMRCDGIQTPCTVGAVYRRGRN